MADLQVFARVEKKYMMDKAQYRALRERLEGRVLPERFGRHTICNIYFDTADWRLIRASLERPVYKEKLRLRSYGVPGEEDTVFAELKKKFKGVVYKRRSNLTLHEAEDWLYRGVPGVEQDQGMREIDWFRGLYEPLQPRVMIAYDRIAFLGAEDDGLRLTFDENIRFRQNRLSLRLGADGERIIPEDRVLMEIKVPGAMPLWLCRALSDLDIYPNRFSKYGTCYQLFILPELKEKGGLKSA